MRVRGPLNDLGVEVVVHEDCALVQVAGDLDWHNAAALEEILDALVEGGVRHVVADLAALSFIDTKGLAVFVRALVLLRGEDGGLALRSTTRAVSKVLEITGWAAAFPHEGAELAATTAGTRGIRPS